MRLLALLFLAAFLADHGIFNELDQQVSTVIPPGVSAERTWLRADPVHAIVTLYDDADPIKAWPAAIPKSLASGTVATVSIHSGLITEPENPAPSGIALRAEDQSELSRFVRANTPIVVGAPDRSEDLDGDGIVDRLDILLGAKKLLFNKARYVERYVPIAYPGGDVPRTEGVCSDTVIRALRNAGIDLQKEVHEDILRAPRAYPMVEKVDASINHRRVRTMLPWFERHFVSLPKEAPFRPGDVVFFDTFPSRPGPDHIGIVADDVAPGGNPYIINNWTTGAVDAEMDLLSFVPVTHHFRAPSPPRPRASIK